MLVRTLRDIDYSVVALVAGLCFIGGMVIYGLDISSQPQTSQWQRQASIAVAGLGLMLAVSLFDYRRVLPAGFLFYLAAVGLLVLTEMFGVERNGAKSWLFIPGIPFGIQASEFAKLAVIMTLAHWLARHEGRMVSLLQCIIPGLLMLLPLALILKQPDLGTGLVLIPIFIGLIVMAGMAAPLVALMLSPALGFMAIAARELSPGYVYAFIWLLLTIAVFVWAWRSGAWKMEVIAVSLVNVVLFAGLTMYWPTIWHMLKPHQQSRIMVYLDPEFDLSGAGWHVHQSKIAIGSGGMIGKGVGQGTQSHLNFLPETSTDFAFAVLAEEWGFVGGSVMLLLYALLLLRGINVARLSNTLEGVLLTSAVVVWLLTHLCVNVGMTIGVLPVTGIPLSFISYGGSALLANLVAIGLVLSVYRFRRDA